MRDEYLLGRLRELAVRFDVPAKEFARVHEFAKPFGVGPWSKRIMGPIQKPKGEFAIARQRYRILKKADAKKAAASALGAGKAQEFTPEYNARIKQAWDQADSRAKKVVPNVATRRNHSAYIS